MIETDDFYQYAASQTSLKIAMSPETNELITATVRQNGLSMERIWEESVGLYRREGDTLIFCEPDEAFAKIEEVYFWDQEIADPRPRKALPPRETGIPVGRIDYLSSTGEVRESIEFADEQAFLDQIHEDNDCGVPMKLVVYRDGNGVTVPTDFVKLLDPPPQGFEVADYTAVKSKAEATRILEDARQESLRGIKSAPTYEGKLAWYYTHCGEMEMTKALGYITEDERQKLASAWKEEKPTPQKARQTRTGSAR